MLVLTRKPAETIKIGDDVVIKVIKTARGTVKIGIEAPDDVRVIRGELVKAAAPRPAAPADAVAVQPGHHLNTVSDQYPHVA